MKPPSAPQAETTRMRQYALILSSLMFLFFLRVIGQVLVAAFDVRFLPPMGEWQSGLLPYPALLASQVLILAIQAAMCADFWRGAGFFVKPKPTAGRVIRAFSYVYFSSMVVRYVVTMAMHPERRWFGGTIPIIFHMVLAAYLFIFSRFHVRSRPIDRPAP
jgi:hypothetical protein